MPRYGLARVSAPTGILARGPWEPDQVDVRWQADAFEPAPGATEAADARSTRCAGAARPATTGWPRRLVDFRADGSGLTLELQPARWALRLVPEFAARACRCCAWSATPTVAGSPAAVPAGWRRGPGAGRSAPPDRSRSTRTRRTRCAESSPRSGRCRRSGSGSRRSWCSRARWRCWSGRRGCPTAPTVSPDDEHDAFAWWPADVEQWPAEADEPLRRVAELLLAGMNTASFAVWSRSAGWRSASFTHSAVYLSLLRLRVRARTRLSPRRSSSGWPTG